MLFPEFRKLSVSPSASSSSDSVAERGEQRKKSLSVGVVTHAESLADIEDQAEKHLSIKGVIWNRGPDPVVENALDGWLKERSLTQSVVWRIQYVYIGGNNGGCSDSSCCEPHEPALTDTIEECNEACSRLVAGLPRGAREAVRQDAKALACMMLRFYQWSNAPHGVHRITMQIELIGENRCSRWHQDNYFCRGLVTYVGDGTWLADDVSVQYDQFKATRGQPYEVSDTKIVPSFEDVHRTPTNAVVLMKGNRWPKLRTCGKYFPGREGLTHKAPNSDPAQVRFLLKVDLARI